VKGRTQGRNAFVARVPEVLTGRAAPTLATAEADVTPLIFGRAAGATLEAHPVFRTKESNVPKYLLAYQGGGMAAPEEQEAVMAAWGKWFTDLGAAIVDPGNPVGAVKTIAGDGSTSDGGGAGAITGYSVLMADDIDAATKLASGCPHLSSGGTVQVCETFEVM
jgi:hypothetical protein